MTYCLTICFKTYFIHNNGQGNITSPRYVKVYRTSKLNDSALLIVKIGIRMEKISQKANLTEFCFSLKLKLSCDDALYTCLQSTNDG